MQASRYLTPLNENPKRWVLKSLHYIYRDATFHLEHKRRILDILYSLLFKLMMQLDRPAGFDVENLILIKPNEKERAIKECGLPKVYEVRTLFVTKI